MANSVEPLKGVVCKDKDEHSYYVRGENRKFYRIKRIDKTFVCEGEVIVFIPMKHKWRRELWVKHFIAIPKEAQNDDNVIKAISEMLKRRLM